MTNHKPSIMALFTSPHAQIFTEMWTMKLTLQLQLKPVEIADESDCVGQIENRAVNSATLMYMTLTGIPLHNNNN